LPTRFAVLFLFGFFSSVVTQHYITENTQLTVIINICVPGSLC
jgi:hypothetical protein